MTKTTPEIETLTTQIEAARAAGNRGEVARLWNAREAAIAAAGLQRKPRGGRACRAGQRQHAEQRARTQEALARAGRR